MKLKIKNFKTEYILIGTPQQLAKCTITTINIRGSVAHASDGVRNVAVYFDKHMSREQNIKSKCRAAQIRSKTPSCFGP